MIARRTSIARSFCWPVFTTSGGASSRRSIRSGSSGGRAPERGWPIAAVGLLGKILGPAKMLALVAAHRWPLSAAAIITVPNDLIWWIPFALYLKDARGFYRAQS